LSNIVNVFKTILKVVAALIPQYCGINHKIVWNYLREPLKTRFVMRNRYFEKGQGIFKNVH